MSEADDYRQRARVFLELARNAQDVLLAASYKGIAQDYFERADQLEQSQPPLKVVGGSHSN